MIALADKITKSFGGRVLYSSATLQLNAGERWALVGPNGAGKTTLLRIVMGLEIADEGTVGFAKDTTIGYLEQETKLEGTKTALQEVVDSAVEVMKRNGRGTKGHIGFHVNDLDAAAAWFSARGFEVDESSRTFMPDGSPLLVYFKNEIAGFAIHLTTMD